MLAAAHGRRVHQQAEGALSLHGTTVPGCSCPVSDCCKSWNVKARLLAVPFAIGAYRSAETLEEKDYKFPGCALLAATPDFLESNGTCKSDEFENSDICEVLRKRQRRQKGLPVMGTILEQGTCAELRADACWAASVNSTYLADWSTFGNICHDIQLRSATGPAVELSQECVVGGMLVHAKWSDGTKRINMCDTEIGTQMQYDLSKVLTASSWTPSPEPGLPSWTCMDVGNTPEGAKSHRVLLYSFSRSFQDSAPCVSGPTTVPTAEAAQVTTPTPKSNSKRAAPAFALIMGVLIALSMNLLAA